MKTTIRPIRNPDTGETVYHWEIRQGRQIVAGGYCATAADARSDASYCANVRHFRDEQRRARDQYDRTCAQILRNSPELSQLVKLSKTEKEL